MPSSEERGQCRSQAYARRQESCWLLKATRSSPCGDAGLRLRRRESLSVIIPRLQAHAQPAEQFEPLLVHARASSPRIRRCSCILARSSATGSFGSGADACPRPPLRTRALARANAARTPPYSSLINRFCTSPIRRTVARACACVFAATRPNQSST